MRSKFRTNVVLTLLLAAGLGVGVLPEPALGAATVGPPLVIHFVGHGNISPGLSTTPTYQSAVTWTTDAVVVIGDDNISVTVCQFAGSSTFPETVQQGQDSGRLTCTGFLGLSGPVIYDRTGAEGSLAGSISGTVGGNPEACSITVSATAFQPTSAPVVTSFRILGWMVLSCT